MDFNRDETHDLKNQLAIAIGMVEISVKYLSKQPADLPKISDKMEKTLVALKKINSMFEAKKDSDQN
jgi:hypothetical protein